VFAKGDAARKELIIWSKAFFMLRKYQDETENIKDQEQDHFSLKSMWSILGETAYMSFQSSAEQYLLESISQAINSQIEIPILMNSLADLLPDLQIKRYYLILYVDPPDFIHPQSIPKWSRLLLAYDETGRIELPPAGLPFPIRQIVPPEILNRHPWQCLIMEALSFQKEQIGYCLFNSGISDTTIYHTLINQISSTLHGALLVRKNQARTHELAEAYSKIHQLNEQLKNENLRIRVELEVARRIQTVLLPGKIATIHPDFEIAAIKRLFSWQVILIGEDTHYKSVNKVIVIEPQIHGFYSMIL